MPPRLPASAPLMKELLMLHILVTTNPDYDPNTFASGQAILDQIKKDYNNAVPPVDGAAPWDWDECSKINAAGGLKVHQKFANALYALSNEVDSLITSAAQPSVKLVPAWTGGPPAHPPVGDVIALLSMA